MPAKPNPQQNHLLATQRERNSGSLAGASRKSPVARRRPPPGGLFPWPSWEGLQSRCSGPRVHDGGYVLLAGLTSWCTSTDRPSRSGEGRAGVIKPRIEFREQE